MHLYPFSSIGGLCIYGKDKPGGEDIMKIHVRREDLSGLAVGMIQEIGADASPELIAKCRELVGFADEHLEHLVIKTDENGFTEGQRDFIKLCENNAGESMRPGETPDQYYDRLVEDYGLRTNKTK